MWKQIHYLAIIYLGYSPRVVNYLLTAGATQQDSADHRAVFVNALAFICPDYEPHSIRLEIFSICFPVGSMLNGEHLHSTGTVSRSEIRINVPAQRGGYLHLSNCTLLFANGVRPFT